MAPSPSDSSPATQLLRSLSSGDSSRSEELLAAVYGELRERAAGYLARERADHTLQPTALVHEAWLRLIDQDDVSWQNRAHFVGVAAQAMRRILVDHARGVRSLKRGGEWQRVELDGEAAEDTNGTVDVVDLDRALAKLEELSERRARIVELRFFGGLEVEAVAEVLGISTATVKREWRFAKAWMSTELEGDAA